MSEISNTAKTKKYELKNISSALIYACLDGQSGWKEKAYAMHKKN